MSSASQQEGRFCFACDFTAMQTLLVQPQARYFLTSLMKLFLLFCARCRSLEPGGQPKLFSCLCGPHPRLPLTTPPPQPPPVPSQPAASNVTTSRDMNITMTLAAVAWKRQRLHSSTRSCFKCCLANCWADGGGPCALAPSLHHHPTQPAPPPPNPPPTLLLLLLPRPVRT